MFAHPIRSLALTTLLALTAAHAWAQPANKPVRVIVGFAAGGGTDISARFMADRLRGLYAPVVIVENRVGAASKIAVEHVKNSEPDGTTILFTPDFPMVVYPHSYRKLEYDPVKDFIAAASISRTNLVISIGPAVPDSVTNVSQFVTWARANPKGAFFATTAAGATPHFTGVMLSRAANIELTAVHYKGGGPALAELIGGQVHALFSLALVATPQVKAGKVRALAITSGKRSRVAPDLPTVAELGYAGFEVIGWFGWIAPAKMPQDIVTRLNGDIVKVLRGPETQERLITLGCDPVGNSPREFAAFIAAERDKWAGVIRQAGIRLD